MSLITITIDNQVFETLNHIAQKYSTTPEIIASEILTNYTNKLLSEKQKRFSFIGIANSKNKNLSQQVDEILSKRDNFPEESS